MNASQCELVFDVRHLLLCEIKNLFFFSLIFNYTYYYYYKYNNTLFSFI